MYKRKRKSSFFSTILGLLLVVLICGAIFSMFNFQEKTPVKTKPDITIHENELNSEIIMREDENGVYMLLNGDVAFDIYPNIIMLDYIGNTCVVTPESIVAAKIIADDNTSSIQYVATFNNLVFKFDELIEGTFPVTLYVEYGNSKLVANTDLSITYKEFVNTGFNAIELIDENPNVYSAFYMWSDGENNYYSYDKNNFIWNKETLSWDEVSWNGLESLWGSQIWSDGENVYYTSLSELSYVLNKETGTWEEKKWNGLEYFNGSYIWSVGDNIFYSYYDTSSTTSTFNYQYILDKETDTWIEMNWGGYNLILASHTWTDGENVYYSFSTTQLVLNKETYTWEPSSFTGKPHFHGDVVWTDGENVYYNSYTSICLLNKNTNYWKNTKAEWDYPVQFSAGFSSETGVWTDGVNYYLTMKNQTYKFVRK